MSFPSTNSIPSNIKQLLPVPNTPWLLSPGVLQRLSQQPPDPSRRFKQCELLLSDLEKDFVLCCFFQMKPSGYSISKISCIDHPFHTAAFEAELVNIDEEAKRFLPRWANEQENQRKKGVIERWKDLVHAFDPLEIPTMGQITHLTAAKVLPLWHGSSFDKCHSICSSGFTYFGKHHFFDPNANAGSISSTDMGFFGSGIYFTNSAHYASMYSEGHLLLSWVSMREPYPVVSDVPHPNKCTDMKMLEGKGAYQNYNAHYIPVISANPKKPFCMDYYPCYKDQQPVWDEIVIFQRSQTLSRFWVELSIDTPAPILKQTYSFSDCYAACQKGNFEQVRAWIIESPKRLKEKNPEGETLLYAAVKGSQLPILQWLYRQDPTLLKISRDDGSTLQHIAAASGDTELVMWLHTKDSTQIQQRNGNKETPLHLAAYYEHVSILKLFFSKIQADSSFILQVIEKPCSKTLAFFFERGLKLEVLNPFKQTLLHIAAQAGLEENVLCLLQHGAFIDAQDLSKRTPIFLATVQGHRSIVQLLLQHKASVDIVSIEKETLLHAAAFYGNTPLLQILLNHPLCQKLINAQDEDGKTPLHKAVWGDPKPDVVDLLLAYGANPNATNHYNYTSLHWAAKHGHIKSSEILLSKGANVNAINTNQDLPLDLAIRYGQNEVVHFFLGTTQRLKKVDQPLPKDMIKHYQDCLLKAKEQNLIEEQIFYLEKISDELLRNNNFVTGAMILNSALALLQSHKKNLPFEHYLFSKIERIEGLFLETKGIKSLPSKRDNFEGGWNRITLRRQELNTIRMNCEAAFKQKAFVPDILRQLTKDFRSLLEKLIADAQFLIGQAPVKWACIGAGSISRDEMCPYSDIEFAFLIEEETPEAFEYFRTLARLLQIQVINLGETKCSVFGEGEESPTPNGFCIDTGGNVPLGGVFELIAAPAHLAQLQTLQWIDDSIILANVMSSVCLVKGDQKLVASYLQHREKIQELKEQEPTAKAPPEKESKKAPIKNRERLAMRLLAGHLHEFSPNLTREKEKIKAFGIKKELYRPFQEILSSLALFYKLKSRNTFDRIDELVKLDVLSSQGAGNLKKAIAQALALRLEAHLFYKDETEILHHLEEGQSPDPKKLYLSQDRIQSLHEIYKTLIPFCKSAEEFFRTKDKKAFNAQAFYDKGPLVRAQALEKALQYKAAQTAYQEVISLNPNDTNALLFLGKIEYDLGNDKEALARAEQALQITLQVRGENHPNMATSYNNIGAALQDLGRAGEALDSYQKALEIELAAYGENHPNMATSYNNIGAALQDLGRAGEALDSHQKALEIELAAYGENHPHAATSYNNIGGALEALGRASEALDSHQKALKIRLAVHGEDHPDVALSYNNIGAVLQALGRAGEALNSHQKALKIQLAFYGENHPGVALSYNNIGAALQALGQASEVLDFYQKALKIQLAIYGESHPDVAASHNNIGMALQDLGQTSETLDSHQKALKIRLAVHGENHPDVALSYNNIGGTLKDLGRASEALDSHQKALKIWLAFYGESHLSVALSYNNIGGALQDLGRVSEALDFYQKAFKIRLAIYGENHPDMATSYNNIGAALQGLGRASEALDSHQKALKIRLAIYGENHPDMATSYNNIGAALQGLGRASEVLDFLQKALKIRLAIYGENHPDVATSYNNIGMALQDLGRAGEALDSHQKALKIRLAIYGENHLSVALSYNNIGGALYALGRASEALDSYQKAFLMSCKVYDQKHPGLILCLENLIDCLEKQKKPENQRQVMQEVYPYCVKILGKDDELTQKLLAAASNSNEV